MTNKEKAILEHIDKIEQFAKKPENEWLLAELERRFAGNNHIYDDIKEIRAALQIRGKNSLSYSFISNTVLMNQLKVDNLRMENFALDLKTIDETERFYYFCVNAFYQIENLLNYYYFMTYQDFDDLLNQIETATKNSKYPYKRTGNEKNVADIPIAQKICAFCEVFFPSTSKNKDFTFKNLSDLRLVRNEGLHRCDIIKKDESEKLYNFFKYQNFNSIRILLKKVSSKIEEEMKRV